MRKKIQMTATTIKQAEDMGAPSQEEIAAYQQTSAEAQLAQVRASAKVAECSEALAYAQADLAATQTVLAKLNLTGAELQQRVNFSREASGGKRLLVPSR
jgi:hypothetical protein